jgi:hypothetical protein
VASWLSQYKYRFPITANTSTLVADVTAAALPIRPGDLTGLCQADMDDAVFTLVDGVTPMLHYWESKVLTTPVGHVLVPTLTAGQAAYPVGYMYVGNAAATDTSNEAGVFSGYVARYGLSEASGTILDSCGAYNGTPSGVTYGGAGQIAKALEFDGNNDSVSLGDVTQLNSASAFTLSFWMNQDVLDVVDWFFYKYLDLSNYLAIGTDAAGAMSCRLHNASTSMRGYFDYSTVISAGAWAHVAWAFDGSGGDNASRLKCYVAGAPLTLSWVGTIPATTANLAGCAATLGRSTQALDGKFDEVRIRASAESASDIKAEYLAGAGLFFAFGTVEAFAAPRPRGHVQHFGPALLPIGV